MQSRLAVLAASLLLLLACHAGSAPTPKTAAQPKDAAVNEAAPPQPVCGVEPKPMQGYDPAGVACWADAALPANALGFTSVNTRGTQRAVASTWSDVQRIIKDADGLVEVALSGSYTVDSSLLISKAHAVQLSGPADLMCSGSAASAVKIVR